eukprot:2693793-Rhodomonas_salina.1
MVLIEAVPEEQQDEVLDAIDTAGPAVVIGRKKHTPAALVGRLNAEFAHIDMFDKPAEPGGEPRPKSTPLCTYKAGWWKTGSKDLCATDPLSMWITKGSRFIVQKPPAGQQPIPLHHENDSADMKEYRKWTPSGPYQHRGGTHAWTDGSLRKFEGE